jgi:hypothetical protein
MIPWSIPIPNLLPVGVHALCVGANLFEPFRPGTLSSMNLGNLQSVNSNMLAPVP